MSLNPKDIATKYKNQMVFLYDIPEDVADRLIEMYGLQSLKIVKRGNKLTIH
jgi:hypothetical protein